MYKSKNIIYFCISAFSIACGFLLSYYLEINTTSVSLIKSSHDTIMFNQGIFCEIFLNNIVVGIVIAICGFLTGGLASIVILFWNGIAVGSFLKSYEITNAIIPYFIYHGIFEVTAFLGFGIMGLKGLDFYINLFKNDTIKIQFQKNLFLYSSILLFIGAIIETLLISS